MGEVQQPGNLKGSGFLSHPTVWAPGGCAAEVSLSLKGIVWSCLKAAGPLLFLGLAELSTHQPLRLLSCC